MINRWKGLRELDPIDPFGLLYGLTESRNSRWQTRDRNYYLNTNISTRSLHRNVISQAKLIFSESTHPMELPDMLYDLTGSDKSKMAASKTG